MFVAQARSMEAALEAESGVYADEMTIDRDKLARFVEVIAVAFGLTNNAAWAAMTVGPLQLCLNLLQAIAPHAAGASEWPQPVSVSALRIAARF